LLQAPNYALAYIGPGPGLELSSNFFSLLACAGIALGAAALWPVSALLQRFWGSRPPVAEEPSTGDGCLGLAPLRATQPF